MNSDTMRIGIALPAAVAVTVALFWLMNYLITHGMEAITEDDQGATIEFTRVERDESINKKDRELPDRPDKPDTPPPPPPMSATESLRPDAGGVGMNAPNLQADLNLGGASLEAPQDGQAIPLVRVPPQYPQRAASRGIEGWVQMEFTISPTGTVDPDSIMVIAAEPENIFNRAARRALSRWKYKPKVVDGRPQPQFGQQVVITFELDQ